MNNLKKLILVLLMTLAAFVCSGHQVSVGYIVDPSYKDNTNYHAVTRYMNEVYAPAGITFKCEEVFMKSNPVPTYDLGKLAHTTSESADAKDITVCVTGKHVGDEIGMAMVGGFFRGRSIAFVDLSFATGVQGKANMVSHEVGHLFGLKHCEGNTIMNPSYCEHKTQLSDKHKRHLKNIKF